MHPVMGIVLVFGALGGQMVALRAFRGRGAHPELVRKLLHVGMGSVALSFPWLFHAYWPIIILAACSSALLVVLRLSATLRSHLGGVVDGVERESWGDVYFPLSVAVVFILAKGDALAFCIPVLLLTLADAVAALVGLRYGLLRYRAEDGMKSAEGSLACFIAAFLSVHVPLLLASTVGRAESLVIGLTLGLLVMLLEAVAWRGLDNLFIPLGGFVFLQAFLGMGLRELVARLVVAVTLVVFGLIWRARTTLSDSAILGAALIGYLTWALGGWRWMLAPLAMFVGYTWLWPRIDAGARQRHDFHTVLSTASVALCWLFLSKVLGRQDFLLPFAISFGAHLGVIGLIRMHLGGSPMPAPLLLATCVGKSWVFVIAPFLAVQWAAPIPLVGSPLVLGILSAAGIGVALAAFIASARGYPARPPMAWLHQAGIAAGSALALLPALWTRP